MALMRTGRRPVFWDGSDVFCMNNKLALPKDGTAYKENTENKQYQELAQNSAFRSEFGYVIYAGSANADSTEEVVKGTRFAVWALMNKYGIGDNDNLNDVAAGYQLFSDLYDVDAGTTTRKISPDENSIAKLKIVSTGDSSTPIFTYNASAKAWTSSGSGQTSASTAASGLSVDEPKTGDTTDLTLWTALALTSAAGAIALLILRRKSRAEK
jgi:LPXTG-motif cell wall-anchored protein